MDSLLPFSLLNGDVSAIAELIFLLFLFVYIIFSVILVFHWKSYATNAKIISLTLGGYFISTLVLIAIAGTALLAM